MKALAFFISFLLIILKKYFYSINNFTIFLIAYFIFGTIINNQYGLHLDDRTQHDIAQANNAFFHNHHLEEVNKHKLFGPAFELMLYYGAEIIGAHKPHQLFFVKHFILFLFFFISIVFFQKLLALFYSSDISKFGAIIYALYPRFIAESHYNSKDIGVLIWATFVLYFFFKHRHNFTFRRIVIFSFLCAMLCNIRLFGCVFIISLIPLFITEIFQKKQYKLLLIPFSSIVFYVILYPYLWHNPISNFKVIFNSYSVYHWPWTTLTAGQELGPNKNVIWYFFQWFWATTPVLISGLIVFGFCSCYKIKKINSVLLSSIVVFFLGLIILFFGKINLYNGWRHLYFMWLPCVIILIHGISFIKINGVKSRILLSGFFITYLIIQNIPFIPNKNHLYFNEIILAQNNQHKWAGDYWELLGYQALKKIHDLNTNKNEVLINCSSEEIQNQFILFNPTQKPRFRYAHKIDAQYLILYTNERKIASHSQLDIHVLNHTYVKIIEISQKK